MFVKMRDLTNAAESSEHISFKLSAREGRHSEPLPIVIEDLPEGAVSYAIVLEDRGKHPANAAFSFTHWIYSPSIGSLEGCTGGACRNDVTDKLCDVILPPYSLGLYDLHVYALDAALGLKDGFYMNGLEAKIETHIIDTYTLQGEYRS